MFEKLDSLGNEELDNFDSRVKSSKIYSYR